MFRILVSFGVLGVLCAISSAHAESLSAEMPVALLQPALGLCDPGCDWCWCGTQYEDNCPADWFYDSECDCGCNFYDPMCATYEMQDCGSAYCPPPCDYCWAGTQYQNNCPASWQGDGDCDCDCQFADTVDCGGGSPDLAIYSATLTPTTGVTPGGAVNLDATAWNQGTAPTGAEFDLTWFVSEDSSMSTSDLAWAWVTFPCCLEPGFGAHAYGPVPWPNFAPFTTPGRTYYAAVMVDDTFQVSESNENNNWGQVFAVSLACSRPGELTGDGVVNLDDGGVFMGCVGGPSAQPSAGCRCADQNGDNTVDLLDAAAFQIVFEGD